MGLGQSIIQNKRGKAEFAIRYGQKYFLLLAIGCMLTPSAIVLLAKGLPQYATISAACKAVFILVAIPLIFTHYGLKSMVLMLALSGLVDIPLLWFGLVKHKLFDLRVELFILFILFLSYGLGLKLLAISKEITCNDGFRECLFSLKNYFF